VAAFAASMPRVENDWHAEMVQIHADAKAIGYNASRVIQMVNDQGGVAAREAPHQLDAAK
jgi:hypothetical protein